MGVRASPGTRGHGDTAPTGRHGSHRLWDGGTGEHPHSCFVPLGHGVSVGRVPVVTFDVTGGWAGRRWQGWVWPCGPQFGPWYQWAPSAAGDSGGACRLGGLCPAVPDPHPGIVHLPRGEVGIISLCFQ